MRFYTCIVEKLELFDSNLSPHGCSSTLCGWRA